MPDLELFALTHIDFNNATLFPALRKREKKSFIIEKFEVKHTGWKEKCLKYGF